MQIFETLTARGHPNIVAKHNTTFELTTVPTISKRADCVIAVNSSKSAKTLSQSFKKLIQRNETVIKVVIQVDDISDIAIGRGHPNLLLTHNEDIVIRRSTFTCNRTLMVESDKAACDLSRKLVRSLRSSTQEIQFTLIAEI